MKNKLVIGVLLLVLCASFVFALTPQNGLVHAYDLDTNYTDQVNNFNLSAVGSDTAFNTTSYVTGNASLFTTASGGAQNTGTHSLPTGNTDISVCYWFEPLSSFTGIYHVGIGPSGTVGGMVYLRTDSSSQTSWLGFGNDQTFSTPITMSLGDWYHTCYVYDAGTKTVSFYFNGTFDENKTLGANQNLQGTNIKIGVTHTGDYKGPANVDQFYLFNRSLTSSEISNLYNYGNINGASVTNFTVTAKNLWNNASITTFNATINGTDYNTTTGSIVTPYLDNESVLVNITVTAENFFENTTLNVNTSSNFQAGLYKYTEIYARDIINDSSIPNFTVYYESLNDSSDNGTETTTSGTAYLPLFNATYNLTIQSANIDTQYYSTDSDTEAANLYLRNHTFYLFRSNTANITFYHERSLDLADDINISASLIIEGVWANNYTIGNGALFLENLNTGNYEIRYASIGYPERSYFFTLSNNTYTQISLYIANGTHTTEVTNTLYDELGNKLSDYYIRLLRYYVGTNSYLLVDECRTNFGGICVLNAELSSETQSVYYKFRIVGPDGTVYKTTQSTRIYETSLTHFISLSSSIIDELQELNTISYDVDFLTATNQFKYTWDDSSGTLSSATLSVYRLTSNGTEILNSTTTTASSSGTIYIAVTNDNTTTYIAKAFAGSNFVQSVDHSFFNTVDIFGRFGIFLTMIIVIAIVSLGIWQPAVAAILVPVALLITKVAGLNPLPYTMISAIGGVALIIIFAMSRIK